MTINQIYNFVRLFFGSDLIISVFDEIRDEPAMWRVKKYSWILKYLQDQNELIRHILMRPSEKNEPYFMLSDDLSSNDIKKYHMKNGKYKDGRLIVETSPKNYQVWIKSQRKLTIDEKLYWLKKQNSDKGCHPRKRNGRMPGFYNVKLKHYKNGKYPLAKFVFGNNIPINIPIVTNLPKTETNLITINHKYNPKYISQSEISRSTYYNGNESETDFKFCLALLRRQKNLYERKMPITGFQDRDIKNHLYYDRDDWTNHKGDKCKAKYIERTFNKCKSIIYGA